MARNFYRFNIPSGDAYDTAYSNNMAFMQYEYDEINGTSEVTGNWNVIKQVKENDIILLGYDSRIYAWGYAIKPRKRKNIKYLNVAEMQEKRLEIDGVKYMSGKYNGIIYFQDCECFYDNLTKIMEWDDFNRCWGQRIDIDKWRCNPDNKSISSYLKDYLETPRYTISRIKNNERACEIIKELTGDDIMLDNQNKSNCIELLMQNRNLILTGAPGTGKTYLAKQVASKIILNKDYDESVENDINFKEQCAFVQFHPSYDYTDFVEGLRPMQDENGNIGFERKDGVFKAFCKKALKNLKDSEKDITTLNYDEIIKKYLEDFYNYINEKIIENGKYEINGISGGSAAPIIEINYNKSEAKLDYTVKTKNGNEYKFNNKLDLIADYYKKFVSKKPNEWKYKDFVDTLNVKGYHTYIYGFLKSFYDKYNEKIEQEKNNITIEKVEKKKFIFIIDEINRGEISKIFGELFFSVDSGYRGGKGKVQTQYANLIEDGDEFKDGFYIPENVYIIGTMNDIDRSVESMDFAMRRRFAWKEIKAEDTQNMLDEYKWENQINGDIIQSAKEKMNKLNEAISNTPELSDAYNIGASYFLKLDNYYNGDKNKAFEDLWKNHLEGLLFEYTRGMPKQEEIIENFKKAYYSNNTKTENNNEEENANNANNANNTNN
ncbi:AAA family ATPase [Brachyspira aalborgi]|uniref:AAA family ATPase n=1 Tax=Brachyspira aalborgi TaxID=29522 RepID=UPI00266C4FA5|nr:AAA family ATPase [Brachyspira aalborgi]